MQQLVLNEHVLRVAVALTIGLILQLFCDAALAKDFNCQPKAYSDMQRATAPFGVDGGAPCAGTSASNARVRTTARTSPTTAPTSA